MDLWPNSAYRHVIGSESVDPFSCILTLPQQLPNGDFATGCEDGMVRIFSRSSFRTADLQLRDNFHNSVREATQAASSGPSPYEVSKLPKFEARFSRQGRTEGDICVFNKEGKAWVCSWSAASAAWIEIGEVTGGSGSTKSLNGVEYEEVHPVELERPGAGLQTLQLGFNRTENPWIAAQRFIDQNGLEQVYLGQIADHIVKLIGQPSL
jgi:phospholipase A-2-activating protein